MPRRTLCSAYQNLNDREIRSRPPVGGVQISISRSRGSERASGALIYEGDELWARDIAGIHLRNFESCVLHKRGDWAVKMASAPDSLPHRRQSILPLAYSLIGSKSVFNEQKLPIWLEDAPHLRKRGHTSGIVHSVQVETTVSILASSSGIDSAEPSINFGGMRPALSDAMPRSFG